MPDDRNRSRTAAALLLVLLLSGLVYANTWSHELVGDDRKLIPDRQVLRDPWNVTSVFGEPYWGPDDNLYRPLTLWSLALDYRTNTALSLPGEDAALYHGINLTLHGLVGCLLYLFCLGLGLRRGTCLATSVLFAVLPIHTEAVAAIVGRAELLAALFGLVFLALHRARRLPVAAALCYLLALWSKESAIAFLPLAVWMDFCLKSPARRFWPVAYGIHSVALIGWLVLRAWVVGDAPWRVAFIDNPVAHGPLLERVLTAGRVQFDYLWLQLAPFGLSSDYSYDQIPVVTGAADVRLMLFAVLVVAALAVAWVVRVKHPIVAFAVGGYAILFAPTSNLLIPIGTIMGERLAYGPSMLTCLLAGYGAWMLRERYGRGVTVVFLVLILALVAVCVTRNRSWVDQESYVTQQVRSAPRSAKAQLNLGVLHLNQGEYEESTAAFLRAIEIHPDYAPAWNQLGRVRISVSDLGPALEALRRAVSLAPHNADAWNNLGLAQARSGDLAAALRSYSTTTALHPDFAPYHYNLALVLQQMGDLDGAAESYGSAIRLGTDIVDAHHNLGVIRARQGRLSDAERLWRQALALDPAHQASRNKLERLQRRPGP